MFIYLKKVDFQSYEQFSSVFNSEYQLSIVHASDFNSSMS